MKFGKVAWLFAIAIAVPAATASAGAKPASANDARFEAIKKLAGDWVEVGKDGKPTGKLVSSIRVTAAGSAVQETMFPGTPHEMVTMYTLDGSDLVLTHYCILGNQPKMRAEAGGEPNHIVFKFSGGGNLKSDDENHMHQATLDLPDADHFRAEWVSFQDGKACHKANFDLVRKPK